jgi:Uma2 family endonuclease
VGLPVQRRVSVAEDLAAERAGDVKHEFLSGVEVAMAGGTPVHALLAMRLGTMLTNGLRGRGCAVYGSDLRVRIPDEDVITYPDVTVVCGGLESDPEDADAATNPTVIVEVLSPSTEAWDRGGKFAIFRALPSLRHYVLVAQDRQRVEHYARDEEDRWVLADARPGGAIELLGVEVAVDELYDGTGVEPSPPPRRYQSPL